MSRRRAAGLTWDDVVRIGLELPEVEVGSAYGTPALRVRGAFMCRVREDGETLAIRCDLDERPFLIEANEGVLFVTPHYEAWPMLLVVLPRAGEGLVRELVEDAWVERAPKRLVESYLAARGEA
ncbi:MAG TPA: MmcQ/YjbR family DNA-binding protein [Gaiellaceae bacterium]|nr:MmcQ/YjbR family DNA-binding protein [Gaiellaceae bacterium]